MNVLAIIPARGGSKGIAGKNLALCAGRPLVDWTIEAANDSKHITSGVLSSDDAEILMRARGKVQPELRPVHLAEDETSTEAVMEYVLQGRREELIVLLQPTSPLRTGQHIDEAIEKWLEYRRPVASVVPSHAFLWSANGPLYTRRVRRQEMDQYEENGAIYAFSRNHWEQCHNRLGRHMDIYVMDEVQRLQVDSPLDLEMASWLLERQAVPA